MGNRKKIVVMGSLDTKGEEHLFLKREIEDRGLPTIVIDTGIIDPPYFKPDINRERVCQAAGHEIEDIISKNDRKLALTTMADGAAVIAKQLYEQGMLDAIISLGGGQGTFISTSAMRSLPFGIPKVMVSTVVSGDVSGYVGYKDITFLHAITDILGLNFFSRRVFSQAAAAICAMVQQETEEEKRRLIAITMFGMTTPCVMKIRRIFSEKMDMMDLVVFHSRGTGGMAMEELIRDGVIKGVIDITTTELADELVGGIRSAGPPRLEAAGDLGIPRVIGPGALDMVNFGPMDSIPEKFAGRKFYAHTPNVTVMRTDMEENIKLGKIIAEKLNKGKGKAAVVLPLRGFSTLDSMNGPFFDLECDLAFVGSLKRHLREGIDVVEVNCHINDEEFAAAVVERFIRMAK